MLLVAGAELLVRGSARLALAARVSPLVVGLTVVAFGTSAPELAVSLGAVLAGEPDIALGNVVGSNIFNVLLILGVSALITPLLVQQQLVRVDVPVMLATSLLLFLLALDGLIARAEGALLVALLLAYTTLLIRQSRRQAREDRAAADGTAPHAPRSTLWRHAALALLGLVLLVAGSRFFVDGAVAVARLLGVSEVIVGLTIIAGGTSLPELATSVLASLRGERDIAVGNVVGSNIFNILGIAGASALAAAGGLPVAPAIRAFDIPIMVAVAVATLPIFFTGFLISRAEGLLFLLYYAAYTTYLVLAATAHDAQHAFGAIMLWFALPITTLTLGVIAVRARRARRA